MLGRISYDGFGKITSDTTGGSGDRYKYTGREWDSSVSLQYNRARYYDAAIGKWTSTDPMGFEAGDANLYRYVGNAPTFHADPTGLATIVFFMKSEWKADDGNSEDRNTCRPKGSFIYVGSPMWTIKSFEATLEVDTAGGKWDKATCVAENPMGCFKTSVLTNDIHNGGILNFSATWSSGIFGRITQGSYRVSVRIVVEEIFWFWPFPSVTTTKVDNTDSHTFDKD